MKADNLISGLLRFPLLRLYDLLVSFRNFLYDIKLLKVHRLDKPVISIGNLAMGGAGKSPITSALTGLLNKSGLKVAVLSRGYGRKEPETSRVTEPWGDWELYGDEPVMMARRHPYAKICVGPNRQTAAREADAWNPDVFLLDDGFQHRKLHRDLDVVLIDITQPMPHRFSLSLFREHLPSLRRAHVVLLTRWDGVANLTPWKETIARYNPKVPVQPVIFKPGAVVFLDERESEGPEFLKGKKVAAWSGIARPEKFFKTLEGLGAELIHTLSLKDHEPLSLQKRKTFLQQCQLKNAALIITTEKDAVKLEKSPDFGIITAFLSIEADWVGTQPLGGTLEQLIIHGKPLDSPLPNPRESIFHETVSLPKGWAKALRASWLLAHKPFNFTLKDHQ